MLARAQAKKDYELALKDIARMERQLELKARLLGQLEEREAVHASIQVVYMDRQLNVGAPIHASASLPALEANDRPGVAS